MNSLLKQRIVGAIVLVALGVIFIPMFLSGEGEMVSDMGSNVPPKPAYELEAPKVLPLNPAAKQPQATASAQGIPADPVKKPVAPLPGQDPNVPLPGEMSGEKSGEMSGEKTADTPVEPVKAEVDTAKINTGGKVTTATKQDSGSTSTSAASSPTVSEKPVTASSQQNNTQSRPVTSTQSTTTTSVKSTSSSTVATTQSTPVSSKSTTEAKDTKAPEPVQTAKVQKPAPIVNGYVVQLGSFSVEKNALTLRDKLRSSGHASFVEKFTKNSKISYRVRVGPELTRELAEKLKTKLKQQTKIDGFIIKYP